MGLALFTTDIGAPELRHPAFGLTLNVDYIALSVVRSPEDVLEAKMLPAVGGASISVIAKIEKPQAVASIAPAYMPVLDIAVWPAGQITLSLCF